MAYTNFSFDPKNWKKMSEPTWAKIDYEPIDYQALSYYAAPKQKKNESLDDVDPWMANKMKQ